MADTLVQVKASGLMCSFCTMSVEQALGRMPGVHDVQISLVHGVIAARIDAAQVTEADGQLTIGPA